MEHFRISEEQNNSSTFRVTTLFGQAIGGISLFFGFAFSLLGLSGTLDLIIESNDIKAKLVNASPGVVFIIVGLFILWRYKPNGSDIKIEERVIYKEEEPLNTSTEGEEARAMILHLAKTAKSILQADSFDEAEKIKRNLSLQDKNYVEYLTANINILNATLTGLGIEQIVLDNPSYKPSIIENHRPIRIVESSRTTSRSDRAMSAR